MIYPVWAKLRIPNLETHPPMTLAYGHWVLRTHSWNHWNHQSFQWSNQKYSQKNRPKCSIAYICLTLLDDKSTGSQNSQLKKHLWPHHQLGYWQQPQIKSNNLERKHFWIHLTSSKSSVPICQSLQCQRSIPILLLHWWTSHQAEPERPQITTHVPLPTFFRAIKSLWFFKVLFQISGASCQCWHALGVPLIHNLSPIVIHGNFQMHTKNHHLLHCVCFQRFPKSKSIKDRLWQKASLDCWIKIVHYAMTTGLRFLHCTQHQPWSLEALSSIHGIKFTSVTTPASHWPRPVHCLPPHWAYLRVFRLLPRDLKKSQLQKASNTSKFPTMPAPSDEDTRPLSKTLSYGVPNLSGGISGGTEGVSKGWAVSHWHSAVWSLSCKNHCCKL